MSFSPFSESVYIGVDVGGSHIGCGLVDDDGVVLYTLEQHLEDANSIDVPTLIGIVGNLVQQVQEEFSSRPNITEEASDSSSSSDTNVAEATTTYFPFAPRFTGRKVCGIGIGFPGQTKKGVLVGTANFPNFKNVPIVELLQSQSRFAHIPIILLNDADAAVAAEVFSNDYDDSNESDVQDSHIYTKIDASSPPNRTSMPATESKEGETPVQPIRLNEAENVAMITLGTGIGLGLVLNGDLYQGHAGLIEGGHMIISDSRDFEMSSAMDNQQGQQGSQTNKTGLTSFFSSDKQKDKLGERNGNGSAALSAQDAYVRHRASQCCGCGQRGCIEMFASARSVGIMYNELMQCTLAPPPSTDATLYSDTAATSTASSAPVIVHGAKEVFELADSGDDVALQVLDIAARKLAQFCLNLCRVIDPEVIILGGGMAHAGNALLNRIYAHMYSMTWMVLATDVRLVVARKSDYAGVIGAAMAAKQYSIKLGSGNQRKGKGKKTSMFASLLNGIVAGWHSASQWLYTMTGGSDASGSADAHANPHPSSSAHESEEESVASILLSRFASIALPLVAVSIPMLMYTKQEARGPSQESPWPTRPLR